MVFICASTGTSPRWPRGVVGPAVPVDERDDPARAPERGAGPLIDAEALVSHPRGLAKPVRPGGPPPWTRSAPAGPGSTCLRNDCSD